MILASVEGDIVTMELDRSDNKATYEFYVCWLYGPITRWTTSQIDPRPCARTADSCGIVGLFCRSAKQFGIWFPDSVLYTNLPCRPTEQLANTHKPPCMCWASHDPPWSTRDIDLPESDTRPFFDYRCQREHRVYPRG